MAPDDPRDRPSQPSPTAKGPSAGDGPPAKDAVSPADAVYKPPSLSLPKGGGALRSIGETFKANPVTGTGGLSIPLPLSSGRAGGTPNGDVEIAAKKLGVSPALLARRLRRPR